MTKQKKNEIKIVKIKNFVNHKFLVVPMPRIDYSLKLEYESPKKFGVTVTIYEVTKFSTIEMTR